MKHSNFLDDFRDHLQRQQCKTDRATLGDVLCNRVAEATRKRFYGDGETPYIPPKESPKL